MLNITDLILSKDLDSSTMSNVNGGTNQLPQSLAILLDGSTSLTNKVADINQGFGLGLEQNNAGAVTNNQIINGGNGIVYAPVDQNLSQSNWMNVFGIGSATVS